MEFIEYGNPDGKTVVYFHGVPGHPEEAATFHDHAKKHGLRIICPNRFSVPLNLTGRDYYRFLGESIDSQNLQEPVTLVGFSIGAQSAISTSVFISSDIGHIYLLSGVAPLQEEPFLEEMAGEKIFKMAMNSPRLFRVAAFVKSLLGRYFPSLVAKSLFYSAQGKDKNLASDPQFLSYIVPVIHKCFSAPSYSYVREILEYTKPWKLSISSCTVPATLWHGTSDNWSPYEMAVYLGNLLPNLVGIERMEHLSHYSCLREAFPKLCAELSPS